MNESIRDKEIKACDLKLEATKTIIRKNTSLMFLCKQLPYCPSEDEYLSMIASIICCYNLTIEKQKLQ